MITIVDGRACDDTGFSVPAVYFDDGTVDLLSSEESLLTTKLNNKVVLRQKCISKGGDFIDEVWCNGEVVKTNYSISNDPSIVSTIQTHFPSYDLTDCTYVGQSGNVFTAYFIDDSWYGYQFDIDSGVVVRSDVSSIDQQTIPDELSTLNIQSFESSSNNSIIEYYTRVTESVLQFCDNNSFQYPVPYYETHYVWLWGIEYVDGMPNSVKAYKVVE